VIPKNIDPKQAAYRLA